MAAVAATAAVPGDGGAGEVEPMPGSEAGADALPAGTQAAVESAVLDAAREDPEPAPGGEAQQPPSSPPPKSPAGTRDLPQAQPNPGPVGEPLQPRSLTATLSGRSEKEEAEEQPPPPGLPLVSPLLLAAGGPAGPEPGEEPPRPEEEEPDAAVAAAASTTASVAKHPELPVAAGGARGEEEEAAALLLPGSEVLVTLDHIIEDALVVSFRFGEKLFSGVLMDLSKSIRLRKISQMHSCLVKLSLFPYLQRNNKRFGPHGIPVTIFPKREYKDKPEAMQLQSKSFQDEMQVKCEANGVVPDSSPIQPSEHSLVKSLWTSKPPPLFHVGAPYPPPLFIRDTYNQSIPQPPPRKIKRPKRKLYREEPTSIMNAIKLRPRHVLCDKCKNSIVAEKKEIKKGSNASDSSRCEDTRKRRNESVTTVNKKIKTDHKVDGKSQNESQKKNSVVKVSNIVHSRSRVVKIPTQANTSKTQLNTKKVLQSKNMDHAKAREVLKIAKEKAQKKQSATSTSKNAHSKVHFTRRLQNTSSGSLPPRLRLKPQRYRNEENDSSLKTGLEKLQSGKMAAKPQSRCSSTRSAALPFFRKLSVAI
ncbi:PWWP domain-containing protein 2A isoform X3 [Ahaetulla prasina]|uniref:PWWP domain-containing protein 2A isoform X3 n=1 Tax=Ahaetulla prasina TaxID=499056 RepID=UPI0026481D51|nr:PWWP domain-containing protein 2A isoform X3 [Ahaetulla prasina]